MGFWKFVEGAVREISGTQNAHYIVNGLLTKTKCAAHKDLDYQASSMSDSQWRGLLRVLDFKARHSRLL